MNAGSSDAVDFGQRRGVREHFTNSRIEFLKRIRATIDSHIEHLSKVGERGTKIAIEWSEREVWVESKKLLTQASYLDPRYVFRAHLN